MKTCRKCKTKRPKEADWYGLNKDFCYMCKEELNEYFLTCTTYAFESQLKARNQMNETLEAILRASRKPVGRTYWVDTVNGSDLNEDGTINQGITPKNPRKTLPSHEFVNGDSVYSISQYKEHLEDNYNFAVPIKDSPFLRGYFGNRPTGIYGNPGS